MGEFADIILKSGRAGVELGFFVLLPVMIVMLTIMRLLEARGIMGKMARMLAPVLKPIGLPGLGAFAMIQTTFVSFAAPMSTLAIMDKGDTSRRHIAATLAFVLGSAQGNVTFPMAALGMNAPLTIAIAVFCGLIGSATTYYLFARQYPRREASISVDSAHPATHEKQGLLDIISGAGREAFQISMTAIPMVVLALVVVGIIRSSGGMDLLEAVLSPVLDPLGIPSAATAAIITKMIAGGTAGMGLMIEGVEAGTLVIADYNRLAPFITSPFDLAGIAIIITAGTRVAGVLKPALMGAGVALLLRVTAHLVIF